MNEDWQLLPSLLGSELANRKMSPLDGYQHFGILKRANSGDVERSGAACSWWPLHQQDTQKFSRHWKFSNTVRKNICHFISRQVPEIDSANNANLMSTPQFEWEWNDRWCHLWQMSLSMGLLIKGASGQNKGGVGDVYGEIYAFHSIL